MQKFFFKSNIYLLIIASVIPLLILGPFLPDLVVSLMAVYFLIYICKFKILKFFNKIPLIFFFIFCFYIIFCSLLSDNIILSFESSLFYFRIGIFSCLIYFIVDKNKKIIDYFYITLFLSFTILVLDGTFQYIFDQNILGQNLQGIRLSSFFGEELILGSYLSRLFPLFFALYLIKEKKTEYELYLFWLLFVFVYVIIFLSGGRTSFFLFNLSIIFIFLLIEKYKLLRIISFIIALTSIVILTINSDQLKKRMFDKTLYSLSYFKKSEIKYIFTQKHDSHFKTAYKMFLDKPIFGYGPKMFRVKCSNPKFATGSFSCSTHPHNFYIQLLAETGIIGFLFLFSSFCYVLYCSFMQLKSIILNQKRFLTDYQICLLAGILITVWPFSPNGNFFHNWLMIIYSLPVGFYLQSIYSRKK